MPNLVSILTALATGCSLIAAVIYRVLENRNRKINIKTKDAEIEIKDASNEDIKKIAEKLSELSKSIDELKANQESPPR